jgi:hypothetical protein
MCVSLCSSRRLRRTLRRWLRGRRCSLECELLSREALKAGDVLLLTVATGIANRFKRDADVNNAKSKVL